MPVTLESSNTLSGTMPFFHPPAAEMELVKKNLTGWVVVAVKSIRLRVDAIKGSKEDSDRLKSSFQALWMTWVTFEES